ncbi:hypothetical protein [Sporisorium scitamineum]|uniref:Uncharacterized protein n=1 Tax=Sporisorium scitamineum TaxID=49012 RepID=A0A0F7S930_9BASI|nr:hypothetical protein [Sporisorium scitamineum]
MRRSGPQSNFMEGREPEKTKGPTTSAERMMASGRSSTLAAARSASYHQ